MTATFGVIGSGWRCEFFLRLAQAAVDDAGPSTAEYVAHISWFR